MRGRPQRRGVRRAGGERDQSYDGPRGLSVRAHRATDANRHVRTLGCRDDRRRSERTATISGRETDSVLALAGFADRRECPRPAPRQLRRDCARDALQSQNIRTIRSDELKQRLEISSATLFLGSRNSSIQDSCSATIQVRNGG